METNYFSVKVTVSPLQENQYRSRIEQVPKGSNFGAGNDFELNHDNAHDGVLSVTEFTKLIDAGTPPGRDGIQAFGRWLFNLVFGGTVSAKYHELKAIAAERKAQFRVCLSLHSPDLMNIPWEYLHDGSNFLLSRGYSIVRVLDELEGGKSSFSPIGKLLIGVANPKTKEYEQFDAEKHIAALEDRLGLLPPQRGTTVRSKTIPLEAKIIERASADSLLEEVRQNNFDMLYFVGHGEASSSGGRLICESSDGSAEELDANDLATALRQAGNTRFVYLNSCSTAMTSQDNAFQGVAQRLMLDGDVAAVAAMQVEIRQEAGLKIAEAFITELAKRTSSPEDAMQIARDRARDGYSFAIPVLYSYVDAPEQLRTNRLHTFLSSDANSTFALVLASFRLGVPVDEEMPPSPTDGVYRFPGETYSRSDTESALYISHLLNEIAPPDRIRMYPQGTYDVKDTTHYFLFGSRSNPQVEAVLREFSKLFSFDYAAGPSKDDWVLADREYHQKYTIKAPDTLGKRYDNTIDYGVIQKIIQDDRVYFVVAGLGSRATKGCGWYLLKNWSEHIEREFALVLRFPAGLDYGAARVLNRKTGQPD